MAEISNANPSPGCYTVQMGKGKKGDGETRLEHCDRQTTCQQGVGKWLIRMCWGLMRERGTRCWEEQGDEGTGGQVGLESSMMNTEGLMPSWMKGRDGNCSHQRTTQSSCTITELGL